jgi:hypothetical protein
MTSTPRVAKTRQRQRKAGLVRVEVLVPAEMVARVRAIAAGLRECAEPLKDTIRRLMA